jgi:hypothetical protein
MSGKGLHSGCNTMRLCLFREQTLCIVSVARALSIFLVRVLHGYLLALHVLAVHVRDGCIRGIKVGVGHETVAFGHVHFVARNLGSVDKLSKTQERVVQRSLVDLGVQIADEQLCADLDALCLVRRGLVHAYRVVVEARAVEDVDDVLGVGLGRKLDEAEALVLAVDAVDGHVDGAHAAMVVHELGQELLRDIFVDVADVDGGFLVLFPAWR